MDVCWVRRGELAHMVGDSTDKSIITSICSTTRFQRSKHFSTPGPSNGSPRMGCTSIQLWNWGQCYSRAVWYGCEYGGHINPSRVSINDQYYSVPHAIALHSFGGTRTVLMPWMTSSGVEYMFGMTMRDVNAPLPCSWTVPDVACDTFLTAWPLDVNSCVPAGKALSLSAG